MDVGTQYIREILLYYYKTERLEMPKYWSNADIRGEYVRSFSEQTSTSKLHIILIGLHTWKLSMSRELHKYLAIILNYQKLLTSLNSGIQYTALVTLERLDPDVFELQLQPLEDKLQ